MKKFEVRRYENAIYTAIIEAEDENKAEEIMEDYMRDIYVSSGLVDFDSQFDFIEIEEIEEKP